MRLKHYMRFVDRKVMTCSLLCYFSVTVGCTHSHIQNRKHVGSRGKKLREDEVDGTPVSGCELIRLEEGTV